ncbi:MAG: hypothetical protein MUC43_00985 [Pirellula sp.]|jgi:hypothetical protein|nr:hypothetical protein [Pirellula sp.]
MMKKFVGLLSCCMLIGAVGCDSANKSSVDEGYGKSAPADPKTKGPAGAPAGGGAAAEPPPAPTPL